MHRYESYKPSGTTWIGEVPSHWEIQPLRAVTTLKSDKNRPDLPVLSVYRAYGVILKDSRDDNHNATSLDTGTYKVVKPGDLVVNKMKAWQGSMGVSAYEGVVSPAYITCATKADRVQPAYLHYLLRSTPLISVYNALSYGVRVGQWDMHYEDFKQILIPLPPKDEQDRIVTFLNKKTTEIDVAIEKTERLIELSLEQKAILINQAVTRGLSPNAPMQDSNIDWIGQVPSHWKIQKIKFCSKIFRGKFTHRPRNDPRLYDGPYPFIQTGDVARAGMFITDFKQTLNEKGLRVSTLIPKGTVVLTIAANVGDIAILGFDACFPDSVVGFLPCTELERDYFYLALSAMKNQFMASSIQSTQMNLNVDRIGSNSIAIPPLSEQQAIIRWANQISSVSDALKSKLTEEIRALQVLKSTVVAETVTGKIKS